MDIIKAMQQAESGKLLTNNFMKIRNRVLKYMGGGVFFEYEIINSKPVYTYEVRDFSFGDIINTSWEVVNVKYFKYEN